MIVFDASGSMAGNTVQGLFSDVTRIDEVRKALGQVLPAATKFRKVGLITYGPGPYLQCNVALDFRPMPNAAQQIMSVVNALNPAGKTPLVKAVELAAEVLDYRSTRGTVVLLTDGEETCGGAPCALGKSLKANGRLTVHVVGYQLKNFRWTGAQSFLDVKCLAEETAGLYITAKNPRGRPRKPVPHRRTRARSRRSIPALLIAAVFHSLGSPTREPSLAGARAGHGSRPPTSPPT